MYKFIHIADVHLDNLFVTKKTILKETLQNGQYDAFKRVIDLCIEERVHALLIAGDLFEAPLMSFRAEKFIMACFKELMKHGIEVFYAIGNHDAGITQQQRKLHWPDNVHIFSALDVETVPLTRQLQVPCFISGVSHESPRDVRNLVHGFPIREQGSFHVGVFHSMVSNASEIDNDCYYQPCKREDLESKDYQYWALGHIHKRQQVGNQPIYYAGNPQGLKAKELGPKGVYKIEISETGYTQVTFVKTSSIQWVEVEVDITGINAYEQLYSHLLQTIQQLTAQHGDRVIPRVVVNGATLLRKHLMESEHLEQLKESLIQDLGLVELVLKVDGLKQIQDMNKLMEGEHVLAEVLAMIHEMDANHPFLTQLESMDLAHKAIVHSEDRINYLLGLIKDSKEAIANAFVEDQHAD